MAQDLAAATVQVASGPTAGMPPPPNRPPPTRRVQRSDSDTEVRSSRAWLGEDEEVAAGQGSAQVAQAGSCGAPAAPLPVLPAAQAVAPRHLSMDTGGTQAAPGCLLFQPCEGRSFISGHAYFGTVVSTGPTPLHLFSLFGILYIHVLEGQLVMPSASFVGQQLDVVFGNLSATIFALKVILTPFYLIHQHFCNAW